MFSLACFAFSVNFNDKCLALAGWSPLHFAAQFGSIEIIQLIFDRVQAPDPLTIAGKTPLDIACRNNSPDVGKLNLFESLLLRDRRAQEKLSSCSKFYSPWKTHTNNEKSIRNSNSIYLVKYFLDKGADINHGNANGWIPLMDAIQRNKLDNVKILLDCGADVAKADKTGKTS